MLLIAGFALAFTPLTLVKRGKKRWHLAAEETFYPVTTFSPLKLRSHYARVGKALGALNQHVEGGVYAAVPCVGMIGYYSGARILDLLGLTSERIAHKEIKRRGRPGHEKVGNLEDALEEGAEISDMMINQICDKLRLKSVLPGQTHKAAPV